MGWRIDWAHTRIDAYVKFLRFITVRGEFRRADVEFDFEGDDPTRWTVVADVHADSLDSREERRDRKGRGPEYLDVERYPMINFRSKRVVSRDGRYDLVGDLTVHGVTREVVFDMSYNGEGISNRSERLTRGFSAETVVKRSDFGIDAERDEPWTDDVHIVLEIAAAWE
ncbi:MAG: hypothetical protein HW416_1864 [Chloroflexi bacterium]|nr:hypothetical protein [Chloroflexota bacterium]